MTAEKSIFVWGFCGEISHVIQKLQHKNKYKYFVISDAAGSDVDIHDCFFRRMPVEKMTEVSAEDMLHFETFKELYSRHWYPKSISDQEYENYFKYYCSYFFKLFESNSFSIGIFSNIPHEGPDLIAYIILKKIHVKTLIFTQSLFENRSYVSDELNISNCEIIHGNSLGEDGDVEAVVRKTIENIGQWFYMKSVKKNKDFTLLQIMQNSRRYFKKNIYLLLKIFMENIRFYLSYKKHQYNVPADLATEKYVYFPLHLQPELTTSILGGEFRDQIKAIKILSERIPPNIKIFVKENPKQSSFKRPRGYYDKLLCIPNVFLIPVKVSSIELIKHSTAVCTITGTVGWEAINMKKAVFTFGKCWFQGFSGVYCKDDLDRFEACVANVINTAQIQNEAIQFIRTNSIEASVNYDYCRAIPHYDYNQNAENLSQFIINYINS